MLKAENENPKMMSYLDLGAGSGYMLGALDKCGANNLIGYEVSDAQVEFGNHMLGKTLLHKNEPNYLREIISNTKNEVVCMIGVLEHLSNPREILKLISTNPAIHYLYFSVPMFSITVFFELMFPSIMPRHLTGGHTHLYTNSSLEYLFKEFDFTPI